MTPSGRDRETSSADLQVVIEQRKPQRLEVVTPPDLSCSALAAGRYVAAPKPSVVGHGLQDLQHAMAIQRKGVSAAKVVVTLAGTEPAAL